MTDAWQPDEATAQRLYRQAGASRWRLPVEAWRATLAASVARAFPGGGADPRLVASYLESLHLEDLALACACAAGDASAWDHFILEFRPVLYRAADAIDPTGGARDAADALYAELYGLTERDGERRSHLAYYHGRSRLTTWLRAVLAQRHVDRVRQTRRLEPLPVEDGPGAIAAPAPTPAPPEWRRAIALMRRLVAAAVERLPSKERLRLACYYAQGLTLAQIGRLIGEHEATVSRQLAKSRRAIREDVERALRDQEHMSPAEIAECFAAVVRDAGPLDLAELLGAEASPRKNAAPDRST